MLLIDTAVFFLLFLILTNIDYLHFYGFISYQHAAFTVQMKSNTETKALMMISTIEWTLDWIGCGSKYSYD